jgi:hypothetical protein
MQRVFRPEEYGDERRSRFGVSAFVMDYTNLQVRTLIQPGVIDIRNAALPPVA